MFVSLERALIENGMGVETMVCRICGSEKVPTDIVENPVSGGMSAVDYMCPYDCEFIEWLDKNSQKEAD